MGNFYTNVSLRGINSENMQKILKNAKYAGILIQGIDDWTVVCEPSIEQSFSALNKFLTLLTTIGAGIGVGVINHDDDVLNIALYSTNYRTMSAKITL